MIEVLKAPPFATIQDLGWAVGRAMGLPRGGAMDPHTCCDGNALVGNPPGAAAIEWALGTGVLRFERESIVSVTGMADVRLDDRPIEPWTRFSVAAGMALQVTPGLEARFVYVAVHGGIDVPVVLGSRSTYLPGGFGGHEGRRLRTGDRLPIGSGTLPTVGAGQRRDIVARTGGSGEEIILRVTRGPQWNRFDAAAQDALLGGRYVVTPASDRMGYRLRGPTMAAREAATLPSEPACPGAIQVPDAGEPIVLMPDGPTVGGYPKIAVVVRADLGVLAQRLPGAAVRFVEVTLPEARDVNREWAGLFDR
jgi:biotin-dependent carboxylase-like uncharacterized protein